MTLWWYMGTSARRLQMWIVGSAACVLILGGIFTTIDGYDSYPSLVSAAADCLTFAFIVGMMVQWASIFHGVIDKRKRQALLMLPASSLEKYLSAMIAVTIVWPLGMFLAIAVGDVLRATLASVVFGMPWLSVIPELVHNLSNTVSPRGGIWLSEVAFEWTVLMWLHSYYVLVGTLLRKYVFVVASMVLFLAFLFGAWCLIHSGIQKFSLFVYTGSNDIPTYVNPIVYVLIVVFLALSAFNYTASFRLFKQFQLVTNKWINYDFYKR